MDTELLCTFTSKTNLEETLEEIQDHYTIAFDKIFVLQDENNPNELFCTYNIDLSGENERMDDTISVHRKKNTDTIYTINALNRVIMRLNGGELDEDFEVSWKEYSNSILLTSNGRLREVPTVLYDIHEVDED